ncbi:BNR-4 repeat-containing protein [Pseudactinotalea suaedae]|uniref:BNR-4 repeat-containing protein n=1 Tax=Pseudactinotalea suaedae TaxID=1524924 RepID=UPI0012E13B85|nr:BNR-4 repeat-containing protein [Pseudactinotalea suaedae]
MFEKTGVVNANGGWCWFQDERSLVDAASGTAVIGSVASPTGVDGADRNGDVEVTVVDLDAAEITGTQAVLHAGFEADDHDDPALWLRADGRWVAVYSRHKTDEHTFWRLSAPGDPTSWGPEQSYVWTPHFGAEFTGRAPGRGVTYQNVHPLGDRLCCFVRAINDDPCYLVSDDDGATWTFGGRLLTREKVGYVNGYARYTSGPHPKRAEGAEDRIDLVITEHHPRDFPTSIWHGYLAGDSLHRADGTVVGALGRGVEDETPRAEDLTQVFANGTEVDGQVMTHCWTADIRRDATGRVVVLFTARTDDTLGLALPFRTEEPLPHALLRAELAPGDGQWQVTKVGDAGPQLLSHETDYTGLGSIDPDDLDALYFSTTVDPRDGSDLGVHEIFHGTTSDGGASWTWTPVTEGSPASNFRPIAIPGDPARRVLTWYRGDMQSSQKYATEVVLAVGSR